MFTARRATSRHVFGLAALLCAATAVPAQTYTGGGATDNWSDPANWDPAVVPTPGPASVITIDPPRQPGPRVPINQDVADPFALNRLVFGPRGSNTTLDGSRIRFAGDNPTLVNNVDSRDSRVVRQPVEITGPLTVTGQRPAFTFRHGGLTLKDVSGPGSVTLNGSVLRFGRATYTGTTTVRGGILEIGGWTYAGPGAFDEFVEGSTQGQGDYFIGPRADASAFPTLSGVGAIGLAPGGRVHIESGGIIDPGHSAIGPVAARLIIDGGLRIGGEGHYHVWAENAPGSAPEVQTLSDVIDVNGVLDLSAPGDVLEFEARFTASASAVVAEYDARVGEFDVFNPNLGPAGGTATVSYTSAEGAGPGQVIVTVIVPEPSAGGVVLAVLALLPLRRRRRESRASDSRVVRRG